ncbi:hypothetical protein [Brumimicrobium oceani]|uniref:Uncharacterized protein n=1 Tax=Brumimicrobium oceani TaxID=2100725 RepID=A0A2U2XFX4_9FLAO|nr:hypothetical protein [Brumimicrobium oceani]PWH86694.1 hypothetical protein DIT68_00045 [Brumimicrobium oceani]
MKIRLSELMESKSFSELTIEERNFVLSEISEQEFKEKRQLIVQVKEELKSEANQLKVNEQTHLNALAALRAKNASKSGLITEVEETVESQEKEGKVGFFAFKIPLWTAIAAVFMIFILTTPVFINSEFETKNDTTLAVADTVYIDKIIRDTIEISMPADTVVKVVYQSMPESEKEVKNQRNNEFIANDFEPIPLENFKIQDDLEKAMANDNFSNPIDIQSNVKGKSLSDDLIGKRVLGL